MPLQRLLESGQQVAATHQELDRFVQHVQLFAQGVLECPRQCDDALRVDFHRRFHQTIVP